MRLAIWNNPLVATSFLLRMRRGSLYTTVVIYLLFWCMAGMAWWYYVSVNRANFGQVSPTLLFFMALLIVQGGLTAIIAGLRSAASIKNEVLSKTLDFQRIASVSPWDIMLGKLLGEPAIAYLLTIATIPIAVFCMILGINGIGPLEVALLYVNILTTALMFGSLSLQHRLAVSSEKASGAVPGFGFIIGIVSASAGLLVSAAGAGGGRWITTPWAVPLIGLFSPIAVFWGVAVGNPWEPGLYLFTKGFKIPFLIISPIAQLAMAMLCVHIMARRLVNPIVPTLSKVTAYFLMFVLDFLMIGVLQASASPQFKLGTRVVVFCVLHLVVTLIVMGCVTPNRELLESWAWRWRGKRNRLLDEWLGERSLNTLVLLTSCVFLLIGIGTLALCAGDQNEPVDRLNDWKQVVEHRSGGVQPTVLPAETILPRTAVLTCLIILTFGTVYQWMVTVANKYGSGAFILWAFLFVGVPTIVGAIVEGRREIQLIPTMNVWLELSPAIHYMVLGGVPRLLMPSLLWLGLLYGGILVAAMISVRRRQARLVRKVESKLASMGVGAPIAQPE